MFFTQEDHDWFQRVQEHPNKYQITIDNDCVWVDTIEEEPKCVYIFSLHGYEFIYGLLNDMGINANFC
jgi:hypothetical protein